MQWLRSIFAFGGGLIVGDMEITERSQFGSLAGQRGSGSGLCRVLQPMELPERFAEVLACGVDAVLETFEACTALHVRKAHGGPFAAVGIAVVGHQTGLDDPKTTEEVLVADKRVDEGAPFGDSGIMVLVVLFFESYQFREVKGAGDGFVFRVDAEFQGIATGDGFALVRAGAGGPLGVAAVGLDLFRRCHGKNPRSGLLVAPRPWVSGSVFG